jgi:prepilin-type N-terminal cleavage/methylation domain-containing protein
MSGGWWFQLSQKTLTMRHRHNGRLADERGMTLLEVLVVVGILGTLAAMAIMVSPSFAQHARAEGGISQAMDTLRQAREVAISQRRNVQVRFIGTSAIQIARVDIGAAGIPTGTTILRTIELENRVQFRLEPGVPDTPDLFGNQAPIAFGPSATRMFTSEGTFVDAAGDPLNGTAFLAIPDQPTSVRAVTIFGATAMIRAWRWNGREWVE